MSSSLVTQMRLNYNLLKLQHGHIEALEEIYHLMYPSIFKYAFSVLRHYEEAEDVAEEQNVPVQDDSESVSPEEGGNDIPDFGEPEYSASSEPVSSESGEENLGEEAQSSKAAFTGRKGPPGIGKGRTLQERK